MLQQRRGYQNSSKVIYNSQLTPANGTADEWVMEKFTPGSVPLIHLVFIFLQLLKLMIEEYSSIISSQQPFSHKGSLQWNLLCHLYLWS